MVSIRPIITRAKAHRPKSSLIKHQADAKVMDHLHGEIRKGPLGPCFCWQVSLLLSQRRTCTGGPAAKEGGGGGMEGPLAPFLSERLGGGREERSRLDVGVEPDNHWFAVDLGIRKLLVAVCGRDHQGLATGTRS